MLDNLHEIEHHPSKSKSVVIRKRELARLLEKAEKMLNILQRLRETGTYALNDDHHRVIATQVQSELCYIVNGQTLTHICNQELSIDKE
jgi:hypothetical protein